MTKKPLSYDWGAMIEQLLRAGVPRAELYGGMLTDKMVQRFRAGVQPLHWRGERIVSVWCQATGKSREEAPMREVIRGHRADRRQVPGPRLQSLPHWPPAAPVSVAPVRKKPGPKPKVRAEA